MTAMGDEPMMPPVSHGTARHATGKTPLQIEVDIAATRVELGEIIGALERKLAPRQLLESGVDMLTDAISIKSRRISQSLRTQPLPLALVGLSVGWVLFQGTRPRPAQAAHEADERPLERGEEVPGTMDRKAAEVRESTDQIDAWKKSGAAPEKPWVVTAKGAASAPNRPRGRVSGLMDQRPLALGVLGLLAGAAVALMVPRSAAEERLIGPAGKRLREEVASFGREAVDRAQRIAERTVDAAAEVVLDAVSGAGGA
jgi:hypothetical protein